MRLGLKSSGFRAFLATQALGAFNDNAFRFALIFWLEAAAASQAEQGRNLGLAQALFAVPFVAFAALAGSLADRHAKSGVIRVAKLAEIAIMAAGVAAFAAGHAGALLAVLFLMSSQSSFFGPGKYGYLAETIDTGDLARANGLVQMTTYGSVVLGQIVGGLVFDVYGDGLALGALWFVGFAVIGTLTSRGVPAVPAARPDEPTVWNPLPELAASWRTVRADPTLLYTILGQAHFFLLVAALQISLSEYGVDGLELGQRVGAATLVAMATIGVGVGSLLAGRLSDGKVELGLVPLGALTMSLGLVGLALVGTAPLELPSAGTWALHLGGLPGGGLLRRMVLEGLWAPFAFSFGLGVSGGFYIVPLWALLQHHAPAQEKGRFLAFGNMVGFLGIFLAAGLIWGRSEFGLSFRQYFLVLAALGFAGTIASLRLLPYAFLRLLGWLAAHTLYRIDVRHGERLPAKGGALLLVNHVSWVDALILLASTRRGLHFLMYRPYYEWWPTHWLFKLIGCLPVASGDDPEANRRSLEAAGARLDEGKLVVVFAEGAVTRLGHMLPFRTGYQKVLAGRDVPIVPVHLGGLWGSVFSHEGGRLLLKRPRELPYPVTVSFGEPLPARTEPAAARRAIAALGVEARREGLADQLPPLRQLVRAGRRRVQASLTAADGATLSQARLLARASRAAARLRRQLHGRALVAVLGPPSLERLVARLAVGLAGHTPWLMETEDDLDHARGPGGPDLVLRVGAAEQDAAGGEEVPWSAVRRSGGAGETLRLVLAALLPAGLAERLVFAGPRPRAEDVSAVLGGCRPLRRPTHGQLASQLASLRQVLDLGPEERVLALPVASRAYGWVAAQWLPLLAGAQLAFPEPDEDGRALGKRITRQGLTLVPGTPALLARLLDGAGPQALGSLRLVWCGEGPLSDELAGAFKERFGLAPRPLLSLDGATGLVALNTDDVRLPGVLQRGQREGTLGHPLPGVVVDVVDPHSGALLPAGTEGRLVVRGAAVQTDDGVLTTILRGRLDAEGFVTVCGRVDGPSPAGG